MMLGQYGNAKHDREGKVEDEAATDHEVAWDTSETP